MGHRAFGQVTFAAFALLAFAGGSGCTRKEDAHGQLMVVLDSDVPVRNDAIPDGEIDRVQVEVVRNGAVLLNRDWVSPPTSLTLPQTVALVNQADSVSGPIRFVLTGSRAGRVTFLQERELLVPAEGTATTVMRFEWLCRGLASGTNSRANSGCPAGQTCRAGGCTSAAALPEDITPLPAMAPPCFNQQACSAASEDITAKLDTSCSFALSPSDIALLPQLNIAIEPAVGQGGLCDATPGSRCFVSLPRGPGHGWIEAESSLRLPARVCTMLQTGEIARVWLSRTCPSRAPSQPVCSPWLTPAGSAL